MRSPLVQLLTARRFAPLFVTQFLGAFNDNLLKSALAIVVTFRLAEQAGMDCRLPRHDGRRGFHRAVLPLLGGIRHARRSRGQVGDRAMGQGRRNRHHGGWRRGTLARQRAAALYGALLSSARTRPCSGRSSTRCCRSTCTRDELVAGNALIEAGTFLAILFGTILGGSIVLLGKGALVVGGCGVVLCAPRAGSLRAQIPPAPSSAAMRLARACCTTRSTSSVT